MSKPTVCFLLNNDFTSDTRVRREADALVLAGYSVTVICVVSKKPDVPRVETIGDLTIHRLLTKRLSPFHASIISAFKLVPQILRHHGGFNVVHVHDTDMLILGRWLACFTGAKLIYDSHEFWTSDFEGEAERLESKRPEMKPVRYRKKINRLKQMEQLETAMLSKVDAVISVNQSICDLLQTKAQGQIKHCVPVRNICQFTPAEKAKRFHEEFNLPDETKVILYQGWIAEKRGLSQLLDMMENLPGAYALVMMGPVTGQRTEEYLQALQSRIENTPALNHRVFYKKSVPPSVLISWTACADLGVHPILNTELNHYYCLPNKIFEYIQGQLPMAVSDLPEMRRIVDEYQVGFTFDPERPDLLAEKIKAYFGSSDQQVQYQNNLAKAKQELTWENEQTKLVSLYQSLLS